MPERLLIALGGNAMTAPDGSADPDSQRTAIAQAAAGIAELAGDADLVLTHGNGPQVGNLLLKNQLAAAVVPAVGLDWCVAQTQGTIGALLLDALSANGIRAAALVTRTRVDPADPAFANPVKPIGRHFTAEEVDRYRGDGQTWREFGERGWRRTVPSPDPVEILDAPAAEALLAAGFAVVAAGGGGIPVAGPGHSPGVEAVIDKDLASALLARQLGAHTFVIATDVDAVQTGYGTPSARRIGRVTATELRRLAGEGHFADGSMGPKVEAALRFIEGGGSRAVICALADIAAASSGTCGTTVEGN